jgi:hypothetical protein
VRGVLEWQTFCLDVISARRKQPGDDLISAW